MAKSIYSDEHKAAISKGLKGRVLSEEHKEKLKAARKARELKKQKTVAVDTLQ